MSPSPISVLRTVKLRLDTPEVNFTARNVQYIKPRQNSRLRKILTMFRRFYNAYSCALHNYRPRYSTFVCFVIQNDVTISNDCSTTRINITVKT